MSFEEIYKLTFGYVYKFFYYKNVNSAYLEDLTQDVFMRYYNKYSSNNFSETEAKRILFGISQNVYREWVRDMVKRNRADFDETYFEYEEDEYDWEDENVSKHEDYKKIILEKMKSLNPRVREVLELRFLENMSRKEVAEKLNMSEKDVHTYQKRGIKYLNKLVNEGNVPLNT